MKQIVRVKQPNDAPFNLTWLLNNVCPNSCSYCPAELHDGMNHHYDWENARKFLNLLFDRHDKIHCSVSGGEPSVSPFFKEIVNIFYNNNHTIGITSNANKPTKFWSDISQKLNYICFSYHPEFQDKNFVEKVKASSLNTFVTVRVMMIPTMWDHCINIFNELSLITTINIEPVKIVNWGGISKESYIYTDEQNEWFLKNFGIHRILSHFTRNIEVPKLNAEYIFNDGSIDPTPNAVEYVNQGLTNFYGYTCEMGLREMYVDWKGNIFRGNCLGDSIGHINTPDHIRWPIAPVICDKSICHCSSDININKWI